MCYQLELIRYISPTNYIVHYPHNSDSNKLSIDGNPIKVDNESSETNLVKQDRRRCETNLAKQERRR